MLALQVHSEILRLLLCVAKEIPGDKLAAHLQSMLHSTKGSRARAKSQKRKFDTITAQVGGQS